MEKKRILIVEDEAVSALALKSNLLDLGYEVAGIVKSGPDAIKTSSELRPDLVLMDITLDGPMDGIEAAEEIRRLFAIPIIYLTAHADAGMVEKAKKTEPFGYLPKPCSMDSLLSAIEVALYKGEADAGRRKAEQALKASEDKFRTLFEKTSEGIFYLSPDGSVVNANDAYARMHGYSIDELLKIPMKEIDHDFEEKSPERMRRILAGEHIIFEVNHVHKDGHVITLEVSTGLFDFGEKKLIVAFHRDITERKQAELALREAEWKFRALFENGPIGVAYHRMIYDVAGKPVDYFFIDANRQYQELTGVDPRGKTVRQAFPGIEKDSFDWIGTFGRVARTGEPIHIEQYLPFNNRWYEIVGYQYRPDHFVAAFLEITKRKQAEEKLDSVTQRLTLATQSAKLGIWDWDIVHNKMVWDERMLELYGLTWDTFPGGIEAWQNGLHPDDRDKVIEECQAALRGEKVWDTDFKVLQPNGTVKQIKANGIVIRNSEGAPIRMLGVNFDITDHRNLENQLRQAQKMESIGTLAGGIAHDFNNILTAIIGYGNIALMQMAKDDPQRLNIEHMLEAGGRAAHLTKDLLLFSRKQISERKPVDLNDIVRKVEKFLVRVIGEDVECRTALSDQAMPVLGDAHQLEQVLMNLATNARDAMSGGGTFIVTTEQVRFNEAFVSVHGFGKPGSYVLATISDTGTGMDAATREHIFEPFFTTKEVGKGTGLGLAVVYGIIKQHEGFINVYSEPGHGTTFKIYLPLISKGEETEKQPEEERPAGGTEAILLAEDDASVRNLTRTLLEDFGYTVILANDGQDAVNKFREHKDRIRLLLFDIIMPKKTGKEAYDEISVIQPDIKILFQSGYAPDMIRQKVLIDDKLPVVFKPVSPMKLLRLVRERLDNGN